MPRACSRHACVELTLGGPLSARCLRADLLTIVAGVSPEPYVRAQAFALALLLVAAAVLGSPIAALACAAASGAVAWMLRAKYLGDVAGKPIASHRERLDRIVAGDAQAAVGIGLTAGALLTAFDVSAPDIGQASATPVLVAVAAAGVYLSSLTDWYVILPRISGQLGARPCRDEHGRHPSFPRSWRETTRWWYNHRILATLVFRFGLAFAISLTVHRYLSYGATTIVGGALLGAFAVYVASVPRAVFQAAHLSVVVGWTITRRDTQRVPLAVFSWGKRSLSMPGFRRERVGPPGPREYVYDVALEGFEVVRAMEREGDVPCTPDGAIAYERHPIKVPLREADSAERGEPRFAGCDGRCSGINWYCIENPSCFEPK